MSKVICIANEKGGVGKTTTSGALAAALKHKKYRVLAVDMDPQTNLSFSMGADLRNHASIYDVLKGEIKPQFAIQRSNVTDIISSSVLLSSLELEFTGSGREYLLRDALAPVKDQYDYVIIDAPPALGILTVNCFTAADCILVPMLSDIFSLQGISQFYETFLHVRQICNPALFVAGIVLTKYNLRARLTQEIRQTALLISRDLNIPLFDTAIRSSIVLSEAQAAQRDIVEYAPRNKAVQDYLQLVDELIRKGI